MKLNNKKRFCALNSTVLMELHEDQNNSPKDYIVFKDSNFQTADEWHDQEERNWWDLRVVV